MPLKNDPRHHLPPHLSRGDEPPHPPPPHHEDGPPPRPPHHMGRWQPPLPTEIDLILLCELLDNEDDAKAVYRILESCPPEVATANVLILRQYSKLYETITQLSERLASLENNYESRRNDN